MPLAPSDYLGFIDGNALVLSGQPAFVDDEGTELSAFYDPNGQLCCNVRKTTGFTYAYLLGEDPQQMDAAELAFWQAREAEAIMRQEELQQ